MMSICYAFWTTVALALTNDSPSVLLVIFSPMISRQMLMAIGLGFAGALDADVDGGRDS